MVKIDTHPINNICWVDLAATDVDAAIEFYKGLMGWTTFTDGVTGYHIFQVDGQAVGGVMGLTPEMGEMPPVWSTYVNVEDADATIAVAKAAGGSVLQEPFEIPDSGRIAVIGDPAGAALCLFENGGEGVKVMDENGAPCWFDCLSRDRNASQAFYEQVFGWTSEELDMGPDVPEESKYLIFSNNGERMCGLMGMPSDVPEMVPSFWQVNLVVPDADAAAAYVSANGGTVTMPPNDTPFGRALGFMDPWGASLSLIDRSTATQA